MLADKFAASSAEEMSEDYAARCGCAACRGSDSALEAPVISLAAAADEPDGTIAVGGSASGEIGTAGDVDSYSFNVVAGQTYTVSLRGTGATPLPDTFLTLFNNVGVEVDTNDDGGTGTNSLLTFTATTTGSWEIQAEGYPGDGHTGGYTVDLFQHGADSVAGDTTTANDALPIGDTIFGALETDGDVDVYSVSLAAGSLYVFEVAGGADYESNAPAVPPGQLDTIISILDAEGNVVATNDDILFPSDPSSAASFVAEEGGVYFVQVEAYDGQTGGYALEGEEHAISGSPLETIDWGTKVAPTPSPSISRRRGKYSTASPRSAGPSTRRARRWRLSRNMPTSPTSPSRWWTIPRSLPSSW